MLMHLVPLYRQTEKFPLLFTTMLIIISYVADNRAVGLPSMPVLSSSKQLFSLNAEIFTTPSTPIHSFSMPSNNDEARLPETWKMKFDSALGTITSTSADKCNAVSETDDS
jgi:hypothetical protein